MPLSDITISRVYECSECKGMIQTVDKFGEPFKTLCPFCEKEELTVKSGIPSVSFIMDSKKIKTLGMQSEANFREQEKEHGPMKKKEKPWWRKNDKVDFNVLRNPEKFIKTGVI